MSVKNILIINSFSGGNTPLVNLLEELSGNGYYFYLISAGSGPVRQFQKNNWPVKKIYLGPELNKKFNQITFIFLLPFLFLMSLPRLAYYKVNKKINIAICLNINEKIIFTPAAKLFGIKIIWLEDADSVLLNNKIVNVFLRLACKMCSRAASVAAFNNFTKTKLKNFGIKEKNIKVIRPGVKLKKYEHQDNLFNELANVGGENYRRKFFTIGTVVELDKKQHIEILLQAIKICLNVIPNIQLIIVGEGAERKNLAWLAKKMEIDGMVWFVGEQNHLKKWLDSFDVFAASSKLSGWGDFDITLQAMAAELPVIGWKNAGLDELAVAGGAPAPLDSFGVKCEDRRGAGVPRTTAADGETLAAQIIELYKNKNFRFKQGDENKKKVEKYFTIDRMAEEFKKIL